MQETRKKFGHIKPPLSEGSTLTGQQLPLS
jgi:hypothetical protein